MERGWRVCVVVFAIAWAAASCSVSSSLDDLKGGSDGTAGSKDAGSDSSDSGGPPDGAQCWPGQKWCGTCVDEAEPGHGCASVGCEPCALTNATAKCENGKCAVLSCAPPYSDCNKTLSDGCEENTQTSHEACGNCGKPCGASEVCLNGSCSSTCGTLTNCNGSCVNTKSDPQHCGDCTTACGPAFTCTNGGCSCASGYTSCDGSCVDTKTSKQHCGGCNNPCQDPANGTSVCSTGKCIVACNGGFALCGNQCVDTTTSPSHCGGCNKPCSNGKTCQGGTCACPTGTSWCNGQCSPGSCCGAEGQTCCAGNACASLRRCTSTIPAGMLANSVSPGCVRCGSIGEIACLNAANQPLCNAGLVAIWENTTQVHFCMNQTGIGGPGQKCTGDETYLNQYCPAGYGCMGMDYQDPSKFWRPFTPNWRGSACDPPRSAPLRRVGSSRATLPRPR